MLTTLAKNLKLLKPERERSREKNSKNRILKASNKGEKELRLYLDPWKESLMNFAYEPHICAIQQREKHYFYSHQKPRKLVYEICLIPIMGEAEKQVHDFCFT